MKYGLLLVSCLAGFLAGCVKEVQPGLTSTTAMSAGLNGNVHGGQQPVVGALVQLLVPGASGYGSLPTVLAATTTGAGGSFSLPSYTCPANSGLVYLLATGGNSGSGTNLALAEAALLGPCSALTHQTAINVSEVSTVAAAYALSPFASVSTAGTAIGTTATNLQGLANAYGPYNNLVSTPGGYAMPATGTAGMVLPQAELNTLADILASCVNSNGSTAADAPCGVLFNNSTSAAGTNPVDTFQAAINIAQQPGGNETVLYGLVSASAPFQPALSAVPNDFALAIQYTGGGVAGSYGTQSVAIDSVGNAWITTGAGLVNLGTTHQLTEISPAGAILSGASGYGPATLASPQGLAIDGSNNVFVVDSYPNSLVEFASNGSLLAKSFPGSFSAPYGVALDTDGSLWVTNIGSATVAHVSSSGVTVSGPYTVGSTGSDVVLNTAGNWSTEYGTGAYGYFAHYSNSSPRAGESYSGVTGHPTGAALDANGNFWYASAAGTSGYVERLGSSTATGIATPLVPQEVLIDGLNRVWVSARNQTTPSSPGALFAFSNTGALLSPANGYLANGTMPPQPGSPGSMAVDGSGNLWLSGTVVDNSGNPQPAAYVTEVIGIAAPLTTPVISAVTAGTLGKRP